jgi:arginyl-tRNA synthetase
MPFDPVEILTERFREAIARAFPEAANADPLITPSRNPDFGDYQSNAAMGLAKRLGRPPREVAQTLVRLADIRGVAEPLTEKSIAGPGFINITLRREAIADLLTRLDGPELGLRPATPVETVVVDLCGVNLAKQMHVGHLRSTVIGDALARIIERLGHNLIRQNHVGDWGLPIAMVTAKLGEQVAAGRVDLDTLTLDDLDRLYREAQTECAADHKGLAAAMRWWAHPKAMAELEAQVSGAEEKLARAKETLVKLQAGDAPTVALWERIADITMTACLAMCARLHTKITVEDSAGESSYRDELAPLVADLARRGVTEESDGALVIRNEGIEEPTLVRKRDGGFLYATTDLAAIRRRVQEMGADRVIYCVDARQSLHFRQVFASATKAGFATRPGENDGEARLEHAAFGTILGEDGRPFKTRSGENVRLSDLLDEAHARAAAAVRGKNPDLPAAELDQIAETVAIAAIKFADLSSDRTRDYVFSFDRMLAFEGATGPYLLYALVRIRSIFRKGVDRLGKDAVASAMDAPMRLDSKEEKDLALTLLRYPNVVRSVGESLEPHRLCQYLYDLSVSFSGFFDRCPVLQEQSQSLRESRFRLCHITERVLDEGLTLLGIPTLERM